MIESEIKIQMIEQNKLIEIIAKYLDINEKIIVPTANLVGICAISLYFGEQDQSFQNENEINLNRINEELDKPEKNERDLIFDLTKYFENKNDKEILLKDYIAVDGFYDLQLKRDLLILEIEQYLGHPHSDDELAEMKVKSVEDLIKFYSIGIIDTKSI